MSKGDMGVSGAHMELTIYAEHHPTHKCVDFDDDGEACTKPVRYTFYSFEDCESMDDYNFTCVHFCDEHIDLLMEDMRCIMKVVERYKETGNAKA